MLFYREISAPLAGLGQTPVVPFPDGSSPAAIISSITGGAADLFATFTGQKAAAQANAAQVQMAQIQYQQQQERTRIYMIVGGVAVAALFAAVVLKRG